MQKENAPKFLEQLLFNTREAWIVHDVCLSEPFSETLLYIFPKI